MISILWHKGPLPPPGPSDHLGAGAVLCFEGAIRSDEDGQTLELMEYEAYEPMASMQLRQLAEQTQQQFSLLAVEVEHSIGQVPVGQVAFRLTIRSAHRKEALRAMDQFIDTMKAEVAIWKRPIFADQGAACPP